MAESEQIRAARRALGRQLATFRATAGLSQHQLAPLTYYGRSTVANVEVGRQNVSRDFWQRCDDSLNADGALVRGYDELDAFASQERDQHRAPPAARLALGSPAQVVEVLTHLREQWHLLVKTDNLLGSRHALGGVLDQIAIIDALLHSTRGKPVLRLSRSLPGMPSLRPGCMKTLVTWPEPVTGLVERWSGHMKRAIHLCWHGSCSVVASKLPPHTMPAK